MDKSVSKLTVCFQDPFWVGIYEREYDGKYDVCKITFGAEPKDYEVYDYLLRNWSRLDFSPSIVSEPLDDKHVGPKREQRAAKKELLDTGIGVKAQQALKTQQEQGKLERKSRSREEREAEAERQYQVRQAKLKEKHRGH
jgi:hypothetical protein